MIEMTVMELILIELILSVVAGAVIAFIFILVTDSVGK
tara:strand:- start:26 stop:139 length:114 start_codon:yes stop_codon:yes gene_type:complete